MVPHSQTMGNPGTGSHTGRGIHQTSEPEMLVPGHVLEFLSTGARRFSKMLSALLLVTTVLISMLIVRIGSIAFEMTGLDRDKARFQALSCFSGTGFTTREAEQVVGHPQRRKVASFLMILGTPGSSP